LPYLLQSLQDLLHISLIGWAAGVHPLGDLIDVPADGAQGLCHLLDVGGVHLNDVSVNRHLPQICPIPLCGELRHLLVDEPLLLLRHPELHLDVPLSVYHSASPPFLIRVWDYPSKQFSCLGAGVPLNRKSASGYSLAVLAIVTLLSFSPLSILQFIVAEMAKFQALDTQSYLLLKQSAITGFQIIGGAFLGLFGAAYLYR